MKSNSLLGCMLATFLGVLSACSHDRPANDASSANGAGTIAPTGNAPTGHSRPTDDALGTDMTPEPSGSKTDSTDSASGSH